MVREAVGENLGGQVGDPGWVQVQPDTEKGLVQSGLGDLGSHRDIDGVNKHPGRVVLVDLLPEHHPLRPLGDQAQRRAQHAVHQFLVDFRGLRDMHARQAQLEAAIVGGVGLEQVGELS